MSSNFDNIEHIVVLMLENRSFDNILGATFEPNVERVNSFYPSFEKGSKWKVPIPIPAFSIGGRNFLSASIPTPDPGEYFQFMNQQIFGLDSPPRVNTPSPPITEEGPLGQMGGFVQNYKTTLEDFEYPAALLPTIMNLYTEDQLPVTTALGKAFAVLDTYHASAPCQTMPNRCFAQLGTAQGHVNNDSYNGSYQHGRPNAPYFGTTIFNHINDTPGVDWKVYFNDFPLTALMVDTWLDIFAGKFHFFDQFAKDVQNNSLPSYSWIEPAYQLFATDNHPPHDINLGEYLLQEVYNTLRSNPDIWESTLLIVTYDEHGGCYDHVFPPAATPDGDNPIFSFDRYGVRVPALLICPYIAAGTIGTPGCNSVIYDHTSILASVRKCFNLSGDPLSNREANASDLSAFLTLDSSNLNQGPAAVDVGISKPQLELQAVLETVSGLGQLWWGSKHEIPTSAADAQKILDSHGAGTWEPTPGPEDTISDAQKIKDISDSIRQLFGKAPTGLMQWG